MDELNQGLSSLVRFGVSDQLIQDLRTLEESVDEQGKALYEQSAMYELRCAILCRNYAKAMWEFCHFLAMIEHESEQGVIGFFWEQQILNSNRFRHWLMQVVGKSSCISEEQGVFKGQIGKREFIFNLKRINLMAAWTAFLVMIEPGLLNTLGAFREALSEKRIDDCAKQLKLALDRYLEPHLQAIHSQRQGRVLMSWLQNNVSSESVDTLLSDEGVLAFWQHNAQADEGDFKRFTTAADCAYRLHEAIALSADQQQIETARSYHQDMSGESAEWLMDEVSQIAGSESLFEMLLTREQSSAVWNLAQESLQEIKFLTAKDAAFCEKFELAGAALYDLPLTFLRAQVFGLQQARITEDMRATKGKNLVPLIELTDFSGFQLWYQSLCKQLGRIDQTRNAISYILYQYAHPMALARMLENLSMDQKDQLARLTANQSASGIEEQVRIHLAALAPEAIKHVESAFNKINRAGFKAMPAQAQVRHYLEGDQQLSDLESRLSDYASCLAKIAQAQGDLNSIETRDARIFSQTFAQLYAETGVTQ